MRSMTHVEPSCEYNNTHTLFPLLRLLDMAPQRYKELMDSSYCIKELQRDIEQQLQAVADETERERLRKETQLGIFVVHNK